MSMLPRPPLDDAGRIRIGQFDITAHLPMGPFGVCVMCTGSVYRWWDLTRCDMPPVVDRYGQLTDQVPLHPHCVPDLLTEWASMLDEDSGSAEDAVTPDTTSAQPAAGVLANGPERTTSTRRAPTGAYAR